MREGANSACSLAAVTTRTGWAGCVTQEPSDTSDATGCLLLRGLPVLGNEQELAIESVVVVVVNDPLRAEVRYGPDRSRPLDPAERNPLVVEKST